MAILVMNEEITPFVYHGQKIKVLTQLIKMEGSILFPLYIKTDLKTGEQEIFNKDIVSKYLDDIKNGSPTEIPEIEIELYAEDIPENSQYKGKNNILVEDLPGISLSIVFNSQQYEEIYKKLVEEKKLTELPIEFYKVEWKSFKGDSLSSYNKVCSVSTIDTSEHNYSSLIGSYINDDILSVLTEDEQKQLGIAYRINKSKFSEEQSIENINK